MSQLKYIACIVFYVMVIALQAINEPHKVPKAPTAALSFSANTSAPASTGQVYIYHTITNRLISWDFKVPPKTE